MKTKAYLTKGLNNKSLTFTTTQKGYGRQSLYVEGYYLMDVFPNIDEHFGMTHENDAFQDEETGVYTNGAGNEIDADRIYTNTDKMLCEILNDEIGELIENIEDDEEEN